MIEELVIHRFRGIREGVLKNLGKVNLLIGPNNSGKTSILEMLYLGGVSGRPCELIMDEVPARKKEEEIFAYQSATFLPRDFLKREPLPRLRERHGYGEDATKWVKNSTGLTAEGELAVNLAALTPQSPLRRFRLVATLPELGLSDIQFSAEDIGKVAAFSLDRQKGIPSALVPNYFVEQGIHSDETRWHYLWDPTWAYRWEQKKPIDHLAVWTERGTKPDPERVLFFDFHTVSGNFTERFAQWAKKQPWDWEKEVAEKLGLVFPQLKGVEVRVDNAPEGQKGETGYIRLPDRARLMIDHFGDGARHAFKVLASLIALTEVVDEQHPGLFLWEDPELFMHPASLGRLLDEIMTIIAGKPIQTFITTQSLEVIAWLVRYLEDEPEIEPDRISTFRLQLSEGVLSSHLFVGRGIGGWLRFFGDPRLTGDEDMESPLSYLLNQQEMMP